MEHDYATLLDEEQDHWCRAKRLARDRNLSPQVQFYDDDRRTVAYAVLGGDTSDEDFYAGLTVAAMTGGPIGVNVDAVTLAIDPALHPEAYTDRVSVSDLVARHQAGDPDVTSCLCVQIWHHEEVAYTIIGYRQLGDLIEFAPMMNSPVTEGGNAANALQQGEILRDRGLTLTLPQALSTLRAIGWVPVTL